jgi:hypothetical protein
MSAASCCIYNQGTFTVDAETASHLGYVGEPLCDECAKLPINELSRRYDRNHRRAQ